mgnify:CR=1 FL=1
MAFIVIDGRISSEMTSGGVDLAPVTDGHGNKLGCSNLAANHKSYCQMLQIGEDYNLCVVGYNCNSPGDFKSCFMVS